MDKKFLIMGYVARNGDTTVYDIARFLELDQAYIHRLVKKLVGNGLLFRLDPVPNEKGAPSKPIRLTLSGLRELFTYALSSARSDHPPYHTDHTHDLAVGTEAIRSIIVQNCDLHRALEAYLCLFDRCGQEFFKPDLEEQPEFQNARWAITLNIMVEALITALTPGKRIQYALSDVIFSQELNKNGPGLSNKVEEPPDDDQEVEVSDSVQDVLGEKVQESDLWIMLETNKRYLFENNVFDSFGASLFFTLNEAVTEFENVIRSSGNSSSGNSSSGNSYTISQFFYNDMLPLFKEFEDDIAASISGFEKRAAELAQIRYCLALVEPGSTDMASRYES